MGQPQVCGTPTEEAWGGSGRAEVSREMTSLVVTI